MIVSRIERCTLFHANLKPLFSNQQQIFCQQSVQKLRNTNKILQNSKLQLRCRWWRVRRQDYFIPIQRIPPADATAISHQLLVRAGYIRKASSGIYTYLPLGQRVIDNIVRIIDEEMIKIGVQKLTMPILQSSDLWKITGRWESTGTEMFRLKDRKDSDYCLAPTHEELITHIISQEVSSYQQLPLLLYQIGPKYRDEMRPRGGLLRGREFIMKDAYSFDVNETSALTTYQLMMSAYHRIMRRIELPYVVAEADSGNIGGNLSHEFHVLNDAGDDTILKCDKCSYAANVEKARHRNSETSGLYDEVNKLEFNTLQELIQTWKENENFKKSDKTIEEKSFPLSLYVILTDDKKESPILLVMDRTRTPHELFLKTHLNAKRIDITPLTLKNCELLEKCPSSDLRVCFDDNIPDWPLSRTRFRGTFHLAKEGDGCPRCSEGILKAVRGIEVGHCFYLGTKYSEKLNARVTLPLTQHDACVKSPHLLVPIEMGCYGIGVSRLMAAIAEAKHDENGLIWPFEVAPYKMMFLPLSTTPNSMEILENVMNVVDSEIPSLKGEYMYDDRDLTPGSKMKETQLLGFPFMVIIGKEWASHQKLEIEEREAQRKHILSLSDFIQFLKNVTLQHSSL